MTVPAVEEAGPLKSEPFRAASKVYELTTITEWPQDLDSDLFAHYPAMKLGHMPAVEFYAPALTKLARQVCLQASSPVVISAPPIYYLPAGANHLARAVFRHLIEDGIDVTLFEPVGTRHATGLANGGLQRLDKDYCKTGLDERVAARARQHRSLNTHGMQEAFEGKTVVVLNDINVSGTQQHFLYQTFCEFRAEACHWLYIFNVAAEIGCSSPGLESEINHSRLQDIESFTSLLADPATVHTLRCLERVLHTTDADFELILSGLPGSIRHHLHELACREGCFDSDLFKWKLARLAAK